MTEAKKETAPAAKAKAAKADDSILGSNLTVNDPATDEPTPVGDPTGQVTNRQDLQGTIQREPTPEELPADAKIAPIAEQVNPNGASQAVGAQPQPEEISGVDQPKEGEKNVLSDASDAASFLPEDSEQHDQAAVANEAAERDFNAGRLS